MGQLTYYLVFSSREAAILALASAGYTVSTYNSHCYGDGWGPVFEVDGEDGCFCNLYDVSDISADLLQYSVPAPLTPYNCRAGDDTATVYRCVVVTADIRDTCRAMVVAMAGPTHSDMWSTGLSADGSAPATHYINPGPVRVELAAMLDSAEALAAGTGIALEQAQYILSQVGVSEEQPGAAAARLGLVMLDDQLAATL